MVPLRREQGEREVLAHQVLHQVGIALGQPDGQHHLAGDGRSDRGVPAAGARQLADVVEQRGQQQQVGPLDLGQVPLGLDDGLHRVPVDGEPVHGVVLRPGPDRLPARDPADDAAGQVQRLPDRHQPLPLDSISSSASRASAGQGTGRAGASRPRLSAVTGDSIRPRGRPAPRPAARSAARSALARWPSATSPPWMIRPWSASTYSGRRSRRVKLSSRRCGTAPCARRVRSGRPRARSSGPPGSRPGAARPGRRSRAAGPPGRPAPAAAGPTPGPRQVQGVADVQQPLVRLAYAGVRQVGQPGRGQRAQRRHVPQPAAGLLEVRLQQVRRVAELLPALVQGVDAARAAGAGRCPARRPAGRCGRPGPASPSPAISRRSSRPTPALSS